MSEWNEYHKVTNNISPRKNIVNFINNHKELSGMAIDIGCGAGNDTIYQCCQLKKIEKTL